MDVRKKIIDRFSVVYWIFLLLGIVSFLAIIYTAGFKRNYYKKIQIAINEDIIPSNRGNIYDANGRLLATSVSKFELRWDTRTEYITDDIFNQNVDSIAEKLSKILGTKTPKEFKDEFIIARKERNRDLLIAKDIPYNKLLEIKALPLFEKGRNRGGLKISKSSDRKLLHDNLARRTIGIINSEQRYFGLEEMENDVLSGTPGYAKTHRLGSGFKEIIKVTKEPIEGDDIVSTIDINMQDIVDKTLKERLKELDAKSGVAILMEVKTGEIRAVANLSRTPNGYREIKNLAASALYEPGSVMKLASFMNAFEEDNSLNLNRKINTRGGIWQITKNFAIKDYNYKPSGGGGFGIISVKKVFEKSSNTGTSKLIYSIFSTKEEDYLRRFSEYYFDKKLDLGLSNEATPTFSKPGDKSWSGVSLRQLSIGYEILLSPYHIITFYNAVANNGKMLKPIFVKRVEKNGIIIEKRKPIVLNSSICSKQTLRYCQTMLKGVITEGTGVHYVKSDLVNIAGKSGTAQIYRKGRYVSDTTEYNTTFVGYFPAETPKYTCYVWISMPKRHKSGGSAAGPVVKEIAEKIYTFDYDLHKKEFVVNNMPKINTHPFVAGGYSGMLIKSFYEINLPFKNTNHKWAKPIYHNNKFVFIPIKVEKNKVPNVKGMNIRDAIFLLENLGLRVTISGEGRVKSQSIAPNTKIIHNQKIKLILRS